MAVGRAATFGARPHEVLFARDAAAPEKSGDQQQRKQRTDKRSGHGSSI